jgi:hypothetical protein
MTDATIPTPLTDLGTRFHQLEADFEERRSTTGLRGDVRRAPAVGHRLTAPDSIGREAQCLSPPPNTVCDTGSEDKGCVIREHVHSDIPGSV